MTIELWSINHKDRNISLCLCGMMPLRNHFCKKSVPSGQHPPINSLHVRAPGHSGVNATLNKISAYYCWNGMKEDVQEYVSLNES